ncbi:MAG: outer membrane beta-barrel protein [Gemmatimonadaceae bacterium]|nr:outer membrane beta-barrel protein [Gemmatimonadaceae bacterium]
MRPFARVSLFAAALLAPGLAHAQSAQRWSIQVSGLSVGAQGEAYEGLSGGIGLEAQVRLTPSVWSFGAGVQSSAHDLEFDDGSKETVTLAGVFFEPRRILDVGSSTFAPYLSGRVAFLQQSIDVDVQGTSVSASASGAQLNGGGGVLFRLSPRVNLDLGATYGLINFGDVEVNIPGVGNTKVEGSSGSGSNFVVRLGLAIGLGK